MLDAPLNREGVKDGIECLVDVDPLSLRQVDRGENLARQRPLPFGWLRVFLSESQLPEQEYLAGLLNGILIPSSFELP
jgi:hypothetical protein